MNHSSADRQTSDLAGGTTHLLFGDFKIPDAPHLIIAAPNLLPLWEMEIRTWLGSHVECFQYSGSFKTHENFFRDGGLYSKSGYPEYRRVILASTSVSGYYVHVVWHSTFASVGNSGGREAGA